MYAPPRLYCEQRSAHLDEQGGDPEDVHLGMRVEPVLKERDNRQGSITAIKHSRRVTSAGGLPDGAHGGWESRWLS